jgi:hypothetical protein
MCEALALIPHTGKKERKRKEGRKERRKEGRKEGREGGRDGGKKDFVDKIIECFLKMVK